MDYRHHNKNCYGCGKRRDIDGIKLFRFPKDTDRCRLWIRNGNFSELEAEDSKNLYNKFTLCGDHFNDTCFTNGNQNRLNWNAIPTLFLSTKPLHDAASTVEAVKHQVLIKPILCPHAETSASLVPTDLNSTVPFVRKTHTTFHKQAGSMVLKRSTSSSGSSELSMRPSKESINVNKKNEPLHHSMMECGIRPGRPLRNMGQTCFVNASLQALMGMHMFQKTCNLLLQTHTPGHALPPKKKVCLACKLLEFYKEYIKKSTDSFAPISITNHLEDMDASFSVYETEDAMFFFRVFASKLEEDVPTFFANSLSFDNLTIVTCTNCKNVSITRSVERQIQLPIMDDWCIKSSLDKVFSVENLTGVTCQNCLTCGCVQRQSLLGSLPNYVCVQLLRCSKNM